MRVLLLGGTAEARALAAALARRPELDVVTSLAGRTDRPAPVAGTVRVGGFGGTEGLAAFLTDRRISKVVDATHPFAVRITRQAVTACALVGVPLLVLDRPGWTAGPEDRWIRVPDVDAAAREVARLPGGTVLLTLGGTGPSRFAEDGSRSYLIRAVQPPPDPLPPKHTLLLSRGPFTPDTETALFARHHVIALVARDSGGRWTTAKLTAAARRGVPVIMIDRPPRPPASTVTSVDEVEDWLTRRR